MKMVGMILEGVGAVVSGLSLSFLIPVINGSSSNYQSSETALFNTLEAGIIIIGIGVIVLGIGAYLESRHR